MEGYEENEEVAAFRKHIRDNGPTKEALDLAPKWLDLSPECWNI